MLAFGTNLDSHAFDVCLQALQMNLRGAAHKGHTRPDYKSDVRPVVIMMERALTGFYPEKQQRRNARLDALSFILDFGVGTTYDLSKEELNALFKYFYNPEENRAYLFTGRFFEICAIRAQTKSI